MLVKQNKKEKEEEKKKRKKESKTHHASDGYCVGSRSRPEPTPVLTRTRASVGWNNAPAGGEAPGFTQKHVV